jgi:DNA-binding MarR family transcriptional regulator
MVQSLADTRDMGGLVTGEPQADPAAVDAVLAVSRCMISPGAEAGKLTAAHCRALGVLASRSTSRLADLAGALGVAPPSAGRICERLARKGLLRARRARGDRRAVLVSLTAAGRKVADEAAGRQRALVAGILGRFPVPAQRAVAQWPQWAAEGAPLPRPPARPGGPVPQVPPARARAQERS